MKVIIILYSLCVAILMLTRSISISFFMLLLVIEYGLILITNSEFKLIAKNKFKINKTFGSANKSYGELYLKTLKQDIDKMKPEAFEAFIKDVFKLLGYQISQSEEDTKNHFILTKESYSTIVELIYKEKSSELISEQIVKQVRNIAKSYKMEHAMIITNATFTDKAYSEAKAYNIMMIDGIELMNLVRQIMLENKEDTSTQDIESILADTIAEVTLEEVIDRTPTVMMEDDLLLIHSKEKSHNAHQNS